ncbi:hypothetical protein [Bernardetia sp.]|uniref:hypothetical protein n=1 Tax=Bernardetia sp. TaxID=1937974 RepID=UPI0025BDB123|nr:hypothetical protein [Bernardetia sp.]
MKNLKKKFGKFAISTAKEKKIKGGNVNNPDCWHYICPKGGHYFQQPTGLDAECC